MPIINPATLIIAVALAFLVLNGLLWFALPNGAHWQLRSLVLGVMWAAIFLQLITSDAGSKKA